MTGPACAHDWRLIRPEPDAPDLTTVSGVIPALRQTIVGYSFYCRRCLTLAVRPVAGLRVRRDPDPEAAAS